MNICIVYSFMSFQIKYKLSSSQIKFLHQRSYKNNKIITRQNKTKKISVFRVFVCLFVCLFQKYDCGIVDLYLGPN